jgi:hypothetical protein
MRQNYVALISGLLLAAQAWAAENDRAKPNVDEELARQISRQVTRLDDDRAEERDAAEKQLLELAGSNAASTDQFLALLPTESDEMPLAVRERLTRIRQIVEQRVAKAAVEATIVTLSANKMPLPQVLDVIEKQTGNKLVDNRDQGDEPDAGMPVTIDLKKEPFWPALDQILDQARLGVYSYGGENALSLVAREEGAAPRYGAANYSGPFRIEVLEIQAQRNERQPNRKTLKLQLEVSWEPRLRPIALSQPVADVEAMTDIGGQLTVNQPEAVLDVEVQDGTQAAEIILTFDLPPREAKRIASLRGKLRALVPGRRVEFRFDDLAAAAGKTDRRGGVQVTLDDVRKNNAIWEIHMRMKLDEDNSALESHRGWAFQNVSYLVGKDNEPIDNAGFETTRQTQNEVGVAYLFDLPEGIEGLTWVYETPAAIVELPVEYELKDIELP